jgi:dolichyl-phosphate beta-glucosyltransferase
MSGRAAGTSAYPPLHADVGDAVTTVTLVVPCYNEADRLDVEALGRALGQNDGLRVLLVDDGSTDCTRDRLDAAAVRHPARIRVLSLARNVGKAEAVRQGLLQALGDHPDFVGYWDADLATPFEALSDFLSVFERQPHLEMVIGSRVQLLGRRITRSTVRHYAGRIFATCASLVLGLPVYDTQCGAKLFRATLVLACILDRPFTSHWIFDVELLARYLDTARTDGHRAPELIYELALKTWTDKPGSKVRASDGTRAALDLWRIHRNRRRGPNAAR